MAKALSWSATAARLLVGCYIERGSKGLGVGWSPRSEVWMPSSTLILQLGG